MGNKITALQDFRIDTQLGLKEAVGFMRRANYDYDKAMALYKMEMIKMKVENDLFIVVLGIKNQSSEGSDIEIRLVYAKDEAEAKQIALDNVIDSSLAYAVTVYPALGKKYREQTEE